MDWTRREVILAATVGVLVFALLVAVALVMRADEASRRKSDTIRRVRAAYRLLKRGKRLPPPPTARPPPLPEPLTPDDHLDPHDRRTRVLILPPKRRR